MNRFNFDNSYEKLPEIFYDFVQPQAALNPQILVYNKALAKKLGLNDLSLQEAKDIFSLNKLLKNASYIAQAYAGHQFGHFNILGDGRALLIGEQLAPNKQRYDIALKGSGRTKYSRNGDGKASIEPMMREYLISQALFSLNIPSTACLCVLKSDEEVYRMQVEQGAILVRIAKSHIRFGTFEFAAYKGKEYVKILADYTISRHFPHLQNDENKYISFFKEVIKTHANLVASWQAVGFIHGVLNTDNMLICAQSIDFGPCAFMDKFNFNQVFSSIDRQGRYSYNNQSQMFLWNLFALAQSLLSLCNKDELVKELKNFDFLYEQAYLEKMSCKLGIIKAKQQDLELINELLALMQDFGEDFTNTFLTLTYENEQIPLFSSMFSSLQFKTWLNKYKTRLLEFNQEEVKEMMRKNNPVIIARNHQVQRVLQACCKDDLEEFNDFYQALSKPFDFSEQNKIYLKDSLNINPLHKTFCGT